MFKTGVEIADRFTLTRRLGGTDDVPVWEATDRRNNLAVALKIRRAAAAGAGLEAEYRAPRLHHPGLALPLESVKSGGLECLVMELATGDLGTFRGQSYRAFLPHLHSLAEALAYLHANGWAHLDLKPANVLLAAKGGAQLADFGNLSRIGEKPATAQISPYSASPQQRAGQRAAASDDIYSFGALLAELLSGQPPGYAGQADGRQGGDIRPVQPAPNQLLELTARCLQEAAERRPLSMQEIAAELAAIAAEWTPPRPPVPVLTPPPTAAEVLRPNWQRTAQAAAPDPKQLQRQGFRSGVAVAVVSILALVALALFIVPARHVPPAPLSVPPPAPAPAPPADSPLDLAALAQQKATADQQRSSVSARLAALKSAGSESWAAAGTAAAGAALAGADALMQKRDYPEAQSRYTALARQLVSLEAQRGPAFAALLQQGESALQQGDSKAASNAFAQALAIRPGDNAAQRGARRATTLDAVYALLAEAKAAEQQGRMAAAAATYRKALALDPFARQAQEGAARTGSQLQADQFGRAMTRAYAAIAAHQGVQARAALGEAARLRPSDAEIGRATAQLAAMESSAQLNAALAQARAAAVSEHWQEAVTQYQRALALDPTLVDARQALDAAAERARLDEQLEQVIAHPERTYSDTVYAAARTSLQRAQAIASPGPVLTRQLAAVTGLLDQAATPVDITLRSDNLTSVTVYRIGALGNFMQHSLQLKPGHYVIVGTRVGYRDVRRELNVVPGNAPPALLIQCVDPV